MAQLTLEELQAHLLAFMEVELAKMKQSILEIPAAEMSVVLEQFEKTQLEEYMGNDVIRHDTLRAFIKTLSRHGNWAENFENEAHIISQILTDDNYNIITDSAGNIIIVN